MGDLSAPFFERTPVVLPYGRTFRLVTSSLTDFAGNHAAPLEFNTLPVPPLIAQDGFESATGVIGAGEIVGAAGVPAITGSKSLYLRGRRPDDGCSSGSVSDLVLRLDAAGGRHAHPAVVRHDTVTPGVSTVRELAFGSVGGTVGQRSLTGSAPFSTVNLSDGDTALVSAVGTTTIPLPAGTAGERPRGVGSCPLTQEPPAC